MNKIRWEVVWPDRKLYGYDPAHWDGNVQRFALTKMTPWILFPFKKWHLYDVGVSNMSAMYRTVEDAQRAAEEIAK